MSETHTQCAIYLAQGPDLRLVWVNEVYLTFIDESLRPGTIGKRLDEVSAMAALRADALREVIRTGIPQSGEDRRFSVEDGTRVYEWTAYRPLPDHVLVVIKIRTIDEDMK